MTLDETVKGEMKSEMSLVERIALYIPIYKGYKEKNLRREEDRAVRGSVKKAVNGYSGFHTAVKILEDDLDALVKWDAKLIEDIKLLREAASDLLDSVDRGMEVKAEIRNLERGVDSMMEDYNQRETIMKGFGGEPAEE